MAGNSESYSAKVDRRKKNLECDKRELERMIAAGRSKSASGLTREQLEEQIRFDERSLVIAQSY